MINKKGKKRVLVIVANDVQSSLIRYCAGKKDIHLITIDNNPKNLGHQFANETYFIDAYDTDKIINVLKHNPPDAVLAFASAHGVTSASIIGEYFNIPHIPLCTLELLSSKELFRNFLKANNFAFPKYSIYDKKDRLFSHVPADFEFPIIIKPTDNGANRGITKVLSKSKNDIYNAVNHAYNNSPSQTIIIEEFVESSIKINGDGFMQNKKLIYGLFGDYIYDDNLNPILPVGTSFPTKINIVELRYQIEKLLGLLNYNGAFNVEAIIKGNKIYFVEFNARHSGNYIFDLISEDLPIKAEEINLQIALGNSVDYSKLSSFDKGLAYLIIASPKKGTLQEIQMTDKLTNSIIKSHMFIKNGEEVNSYSTLADRIGVLMIETVGFKDQKELLTSFKIILE